jgi:hypothetical protein
LTSLRDAIFVYLFSFRMKTTKSGFLNNCKQYILYITAILLFNVGNLVAQTDTTGMMRFDRPEFAKADSSLPVKQKPARIVIPAKATMMAASFPGLGQVYNRKYWKIPIVYAGFGALGYSIVINSRGFNNYLNAYSDLTDGIPETISYQELLSTFDPGSIDPALEADNYNSQENSWVKERLLNAVGYYRKNRDLSYIGVGFWYLLSILDAHVDAVLYDFDISRDLSVTVEPVPIAISHGSTIGLGMKVTF